MAHLLLQHPKQLSENFSALKKPKLERDSKNKKCPFACCFNDMEKAYVKLVATKKVV